MTAQVALSFLLLFGAGLFVRSLQNLKTTDTGVALDNLRGVPAVSGAERLRRRSARCCSTSSCWSACASAPGVKSAAFAAVPILVRRRMGQLHVGRGPPVRRRRGHAGVHERALARLLRDDADSDSRRARLHDTSDVGEQFDGRDRQQARSRITSSRARAPSASTSGAAADPNTKLTIEIVGVVADSLYEGPREGVRRQVFVPNWGKNSVGVLRARATSPRRAPSTRSGTKCKQLDAAMPVYSMKTLEGAARRDAADRPVDRAAVGGIRPAGDNARLDRALRCDGVRRRPAPQGAGHPAGARRAARAA